MDESNALVIDGDLIRSITELPKDSTLLNTIIKDLLTAGLFTSQTQIHTLMEKYSTLF